MSKRISAFCKLGLALAFVLALSGGASAKKHSDPAFSNIKIDNFGQMDERFYRGGRPKAKEFAALKALGIQTVIDLTDNTPEERGYVEGQGMRYVNIAVPDKKDPSDAQIQQFLDVVNNPETESSSYTAQGVVTGQV